MVAENMIAIRTGHRPVNKEIGPDRSKFHVPQIT